MPEATAVEEKKAPPGLEEALRARILDLLTPSTPGGPFRLPAEASVDLAVAGAPPSALEAALSLVKEVRPNLVVAKVLASVGRTLRPDATKLVTNVLPRLNERGSGLALSLMGRRNKVLESVVLWEGDFCTPAGPASAAPDQALAIAAAAWIQFHLAPVRRKDAKGYKRAFGTTSWLSFAHFQVASARQQLEDWPGAEKAYAAALTADHLNVRATFNAAVVDMRRRHTEQAVTRLRSVAAHVDSVANPIEAKDSCCEPFPPSPFWYQAHYQLAAALFHRGIEDTDDRLLAEAEESALKLALSTVCAILTLDPKRNASATKLRGFLDREIEGQALVLLADAIARRRPVTDAQPGALAARPQLLNALSPHGRAVSAGVSPEALVAFVTRGGDVPHPRVCYNLACYYSGRAGKAKGKASRDRHLVGAVNWLSFALESGDLCSWAIKDPSLERVRKECEKEFADLCSGFERSGDLHNLRAVGELAGALGKIGVSTAAELLEKAGTSGGADEIASAAGVPHARVEQWKELARLATLGIPLVAVNLLEGVDVRNVEDLARCKPSMLFDLVDAAGRAGAVENDAIPSRVELRTWIDKAEREEGPVASP